jgi:hypothetical protein
MAEVAAEIESAPPQGPLGRGVHPLAAREAWVQSVDLGFLGVQVGLGHGLDLAVGAGFSPGPTGLDALPVLEVGWARAWGDWRVRGLLGGGVQIGFHSDGAAAFVVGAGAGVGVAWGPRERHVAATLRVLDLPSLSAGGFNLAVDGVWTLSPHWAVMGAATWTLATNEYAETHALGIGPAGRIRLDPWSIDLGVHLTGVIGEAGDLPPFVPLPVLTVRYGFGVATAR